LGVLAVALLVLTTGCVEKLAKGRVKSALIESGLSEPNAECMAERMTDRLSLGQLRKLQALQGEKRNLSQYVAAVRKVGDAEVLAVTTSSAALCATGLANEKK
jgi:hypothetical protein